MTDLDLAISADVATITMSDGQNRIGAAAVAAWNEAFDVLEANDGVSALIVTGTDRYWSTGLDLDEVETLDPDDLAEFMGEVDRLLARITFAPFATIAALNGHAYAAGALLSLAHDYRIMRRDRGFFCLPSIDVRIPFSPGMSSLIAAKLPQPIAHDLVISCRKIGGDEAEATGVIHIAADDHDVIPQAEALARSLVGKDRTTMTTVKRRMYPRVADQLGAS
ncbi:MAG: enoyl-CoA hydratase/isomerase family protein [Acidimicrobiia bacterium]